VKEPVWLNRIMVDAMHFDQLQQHGGTHGIRDENALKTTLFLPKNVFASDNRNSLPALASVYGVGFATNHAYRDGNERVAFAAMHVFLGLNGHDILVAESDVIRLMLDLTAGKVGDRKLTNWLRAHISPPGA
jgi:death-on-curing protein